MSNAADIVAYDRDGRLALVVEVKKKLGTSSEWAAKLRRNILAHGVFLDAKFVLLATPDRFYLWKDGGAEPALKEPDFQIDPRVLLRPYLERAGATAEGISGWGFELIVASWLADLVRADGLSAEVETTQGWVADSGIYDALRGGRLEHAIPA